MLSVVLVTFVSTSFAKTPLKIAAYGFKCPLYWVKLTISDEFSAPVMSSTKTFKKYYAPAYNLFEIVIYYPEP